jgi:ADP-ribose pyrophosphatase YjhB (NUDIX family)
VTIRNVEVRVECCRAEETPAAYCAMEENTGAPDEASVRVASAHFLREAGRRGVSSIALPALGVSGGFSPIASGKIMAQEIIRLARGKGSPLRTVWLCNHDRGSFPEFEKAVLGYIQHFIDVLSWGPFVTVDAVIEISSPGRPRGLVLVKRSNPPFGFALPGGFVDYGESLEDAVRREAMEETGLVLLDLRQFHTYSSPDRDPRFHTVTTVFTAGAEGVPRAGDDAADVHVASPGEIGKLHFAFDHGKVLRDYLAAGTSADSPRSPSESPDG